MVLKRLEIQGFKSFADKTVFTFEHGATAIVGPNGSGKSNVSDAVRWVLGEQRGSTLRSGKMEDVIFSGTQNRSPLSYAEVSLVIDNAGGLLPADGAEVMITRRYYRSGESEHYINRVGVRLKDIHELFFDTGLGRDGYSIIGQGRIDEILSVRATDRREIFEEAAGIAKFRHRKNESERKLHSAEENLLRIGDRISELEPQVGPLREQAEAAKQYLSLRDELRIHEINAWMDSLDKLQASHTKLRSDEDGVVGQAEAVKLRLDEAYTAREKLSEQAREADIQAEELRTLLSGIEARSAELDGQTGVFRANIQNLEDNIARLTREMGEHDERSGGLSGQIGQRTQELQDSRETLNKLQGEIAGLLAEAETHAAAAGDASLRIDALTAKEGQLTAEQNADGLKRMASETVLSELAGRLAETEEALAGIGKRRIEAQAERDAASVLLAAEQEQAAGLHNVCSGYEMRVKSITKRFDDAKERHVAQTMELGALRDRIQLLGDLEREYEGFSRAVRMVMQESERGGLSGVRDTVAGLLTVDDNCALAMEIALGAAMQNVVVEDEEDAKAAIGMLKRRDGGRATFLPMASVRGSALSIPGLEREPGCLGLASDLVRYDAAYQGIVWQLLGRTAVTEDMDAAVSLARKHRYSFRIVTLDGQLVSAGGAMTGGSSGTKTGVFTRRNEKERAETKAAEVTKTLSETKRALEAAERELSKANYDLDAARGELAESEKNIITLQGGAAQLAQTLAALEETALAEEAGLAELKARIAAAQAEMAASAQGMAGRALALESLRGELADMQAEHGGLLSEGAGLADRMNALRVEAARIGEKAAAEERALAEYQTLLAETGESRQRMETLAAEYRASIEGWQGEIQERQQAQSGIAGERETTQKSIAAVQERKLNLEAERVRLERGLKDDSEAQLNIDRERSRIEHRRQAADFEEGQIIDKLLENYRLSRTQAQELRTPMESVSKTNRRIAELRREMDALGTPNLGAIEEYKRVSERYGFLTAQREDAAAAKDELLAMIGEIAERMKETFLEQFAVINKLFGETFADIFGGGQAALELEDPADVLNSGIAIKAQPPGKVIKYIAALSGGERALVAIALYFAVLKAHPTPFCVLDEIDAALDDVNVGLFAAYLARLSLGTQFIIITHRRGTMEVADRLYGITMQEKGVSKVLALDVKEVEEEMVG